MKRVEKRTLLELLLIIIAISGLLYKAYTEEKPYVDSEKTYEKLQKLSDGVSGEETENIDFEALKNLNPEIVAWIKVPGTQINYPVCRNSDISFYLTHNAEKEENKLGAIFTLPENSQYFTDPHEIIFGHNAKHGQMFGELSNYQNETFVEDNPCFYLYLPNETRKYQVFSIYEAAPTSDAYTIGFISRSEEYEKWIYDMCQKSEIKLDVQPTASDRVVTLSTCADSNRKKRLVVHGVEIK